MINNDDADSQGYIPNFLGVSMDNVYSLNLTQAQGIKLSQAIAADPKSCNRNVSGCTGCANLEEMRTNWPALARQDP